LKSHERQEVYEIYGTKEEALNHYNEYLSNLLKDDFNTVDGKVSPTWVAYEMFNEFGDRFLEYIDKDIMDVTVDIDWEINGKDIYTPDANGDCTCGCKNLDTTAYDHPFPTRGFYGLPDSSRVKLPQRGTSGSACYDFFSPIDITIPAWDTVKIASKVVAYMQDDEVLVMHVRSSMGMKGIQLTNVTAIIDAR